MTKNNKLTWYNLVNKLKKVTIPEPPKTGNYKLESTNGVVSWVEIE
jgi:hypothetical protein